MNKKKIWFFPYKISMWDSLESICLAAMEDERCEVMVCPVPYRYYDAINDSWVDDYEGNAFNPELPLFDFNNLDLEKENIDVAYIHNPYDEYNFITRVFPDFFSWNLKKYVKKLVYVPYFVTIGYASNEQLDLAAYRNVDYLMVQSNTYKEAYRDGPYYNKVVALGSPKLDRVYYYCKEGVLPMESWRNFIGDRKCVMLNTSINMVLTYGLEALQKLLCVFRLMKDHPKVALVWRPHPLMAQTLFSMRPQLLEAYSALLEAFIKERVGIYDDTVDDTATVAICDGYIGEGATSMIALFMAANKPVFILDKDITERIERPRPALGSEYFFRREGSWGFYAAESVDYVLPEFLEDLAEGRLEEIVPRQIEAISDMAVNMDGTAGSAIHEYMMKVLGA